MTAPPWFSEARRPEGPPDGVDLAAGADGAVDGAAAGAEEDAGTDEGAGGPCHVSYMPGYIGRVSLLVGSR